MTNSVFILTLFILLFSVQVKAEPIQIALTFDDLPYVWDTPPDGYSNKKLIQEIIAVLARHHVAGAFAFVNAGKVTTPESKEILDLWVKTGHVLGNHTWSHPDLNNISSADYIEEIEKDGNFLRAYGPSFFKYFRYPFLHEGNTQEKRTSVRSHLFKSGYRIAQVTIDHNDWEWYAPLARCLKQGNQEKIAWLRNTYNAEARENLKASRLLSEFLFGRKIKHIALFHPNIMTVEQLDRVLTDWNSAGAQFIPLQEAMNDPVYEIDPNIVADSPNIFINQVRIMRGLKNPPEVLQIYRNTEVLEQALATTCGDEHLN